MTTQTVLLDLFDYGASPVTVTLHNPDTMVLADTADTVTQNGVNGCRYVAVFSRGSVLAAGVYAVGILANGIPGLLYCTLTGVDGETAIVRGERPSLATVETKVDAFSVGLAGMSPVEPTGATVFEHLEQIQGSIDTYIASVTAVNGSSGTIVGFPATLTIGNSYTTDGSNAIHVFIRDENDDPITSVGTHDFTDPDFSCDLIITNSGNAGRVRATVTYVDPGAAESYLKVEIPLSESSRAAAGAATMQCTLKWDGVAKTIATQTVTWVARI